MRMSDTIISIQRKRGRQKGEAQLYAEVTVPTTVNLPPSLKKRVIREMNYRNQSGDTSYWTYARVVVDILANHFGLDLQEREA